MECTKDSTKDMTEKLTEGLAKIRSCCVIVSNYWSIEVPFKRSYLNDSYYSICYEYFHVQKWRGRVKAESKVVQAKSFEKIRFMCQSAHCTYVSDIAEEVLVWSMNKNAYSKISMCIEYFEMNLTAVRAKKKDHARRVPSLEIWNLISSIVVRIDDTDKAANYLWNWGRKGIAASNLC